MLDIGRENLTLYGGAKCSRASMERRRLLNARITASRHRKWQEVKLEREEAARREALEILELRRKERARLAEYIHRGVQPPAKPKAQRNFNKQEICGHKKPRWNSSALLEDRETDAMRVVSKTPSSNHVHGGRIHIADRLFFLRHAHELRTATNTPQPPEHKESVGSKEQLPAADTGEGRCDPWACDTYERNIRCATPDYSAVDLDDDEYYAHRDAEEVTDIGEDTIMTESSVATGHAAGNLTAYPGGLALPKVLNVGFSKRGCDELMGTSFRGKQYTRDEYLDTEATSVLESSHQVFVSRSTSPSISVANSGHETACNCSSPREEQSSPASVTHVADAHHTIYNGSSLQEEIVKARLANEAATARLIAEVTAIQSRLAECNHPEPLDFGGDDAEILMEQPRPRPEVCQTPTMSGDNHETRVLLEECTCSHKDQGGTIQVHNRAMTGQLSDLSNDGTTQFNSAVAALTAYCVSPSDEQGYKRARGPQGHIKITRDATQNWVPTHQKFVNDNPKLQLVTDNSRQAAAIEAPKGETKTPAYTAWDIGWGGQDSTPQRQPQCGPSSGHLAQFAAKVPAMNTPKSSLSQPQTNFMDCNVMHRAVDAKQSTQGNTEQPSESCILGRRSNVQLPLGAFSDTPRSACVDSHSKQAQLHRPTTINHDDSRETFEVHQVNGIRESHATRHPSEKTRNPLEDQHIKAFREPLSRHPTYQRGNEGCLSITPAVDSGKVMSGMPMSATCESGRPDEIHTPKLPPFCTVQDNRPSTALPPRDYCLAPQVARQKFPPGKRDNHEHTASSTTLSEEERNILASLEKLDIKLAAVSARISKSACNSVISDGETGSVRSAPTVMVPPSTFPGSSLISLGSRPRKCCVMNPRSPMTPQAPRPFRGQQRRMVGLTNNCRQNSQPPPFLGR